MWSALRWRVRMARVVKKEKVLMAGEVFFVGEGEFFRGLLRKAEARKRLWCAAKGRAFTEEDKEDARGEAELEEIKLRQPDVVLAEMTMALRSLWSAALPQEVPSERWVFGGPLEDMLQTRWTWSISVSSFTVASPHGDSGVALDGFSVRASRVRAARTREYALAFAWSDLQAWRDRRAEVDEHIKRGAQMLRTELDRVIREAHS